MEKIVQNGIIIEHNCIATDVYSMTIEAPDIVKSADVGRFINIYPRGKNTLLPRPISISEITDTTLTIVYAVVGQGTLEFSTYKVGEEIKISSAMGNGFTVQNVETHILVGAGS